MKEDKFELTVMAMRERIMAYFKSNCVTAFLQNPYLTWNTPPSQGRQYQYRRSENTMRSPRHLCLGDIELLEVQKQPNIVRLYRNTLTANDILKKMDGEINAIFRTYLPGVKVEYVNKGSKDVENLGKWMNYTSLIEERGESYDVESYEEDDIALFSPLRTTPSRGLDAALFERYHAQMQQTIVMRDSMFWNEISDREPSDD